MRIVRDGSGGLLPKRLFGFRAARGVRRGVRREGGRRDGVRGRWERVFLGREGWAERGSGGRWRNARSARREAIVAMG